MSVDFLCNGSASIRLSLNSTGDNRAFEYVYVLKELQ